MKKSTQRNAFYVFAIIFNEYRTRYNASPPLAENTILPESRDFKFLRNSHHETLRCWRNKKTNETPSVFLGKHAHIVLLQLMKISTTRRRPPNRSEHVLFIISSTHWKFSNVTTCMKFNCLSVQIQIWPLSEVRGQSVVSFECFLFFLYIFLVCSVHAKKDKKVQHTCCFFLFMLINKIYGEAALGILY